MARPTRFELVTPAFGARRFICAFARVTASRDRHACTAPREASPLCLRSRLPFYERTQLLRTMTESS
jgi:hypothetical protein